MIPFKVDDDWNLITRTIVPVTDVVNIIPGNPAGIGDTVQSFFLSPAKPVNRIILGAGPVFLYPTATRDEISANQWGAGPTFVGLTQSTAFTVGILANHIWGIGPPGENGLGGGSILSDDGCTIPVPPGRSPVINATYLNPFASYTFPSQTTLNLSFERPTIGLRRPGPCRSSPASPRFQSRRPANQCRLFGKYYVVRPEGAPALGTSLRAYVSCFRSRRKPAARMASQVGYFAVTSIAGIPLATAVRAVSALLRHPSIAPSTIQPRTDGSGTTGSIPPPFGPIAALPLIKIRRAVEIRFICRISPLFVGGREFRSTL